MANLDDESKSDGLEILSIGALYTGDWDKKYWSSSRGKDRYPYPVGYQALRTHKGLTYKMAILEGSKGPIFQITSNDEQFGSGETPDRAWENFQKKCCSRIKLWHGKRFSGKLDGVEFFGFKNALVQRLLRELVAINDASDLSSVSTHCNEASSKGRRSRNCRGIDTKSTCKSGHGRSQPPHQGVIAKVLYSAPGKTHTDETPIFRALSDLDAGEALKVLSNIEGGENVSSPAHGLPIKSQDVSADSKAEFCSIQAQSKCLSKETCVAASSLGIGLPHEEKFEEVLNVSQLDRLCVQAKGVGLPVATEEGNQEMQVLPDLQEPRSPMLRDSEVNLFVPDTYDTQQEITCDLDIGSHKGEQTIARDGADLIFPNEKTMESHSEEGSHYLNDNSERSDFDFGDEDITKTMMAILLPRAVPFLTYSSRKKRRKTKPAEDLSCAPKVEISLNEVIPSADVESPARILASSSSDGQKKAHLSSVIDSSLSTMNLIVPDSLDDDHYEDQMDNKLPPPSDNGESVAANLQKERQQHDNIRSSLVFDAMESSSHQIKVIPLKEAFSHELQKDLDGMSQNNCVLGLHSAVPDPIPVQLDLVAKPEDQCLNADGSFITIECFSKNTALEIMPDFDGSRFVRVPGKQQSAPLNEPSKMGTYDVPLSESIICSNTRDNCAPEMLHLSGNLVLLNSSQGNVFGDSDSRKAAFIGGRVDGQIFNLLNQPMKDALAQNCVCQEQAVSSTINKNDIQIVEGCNVHSRHSDGYIDKETIGNQISDPINQSVDQGKDPYRPHIREEEADVHTSCVDKQELNGELKGIMKLIGCYSHPMRISSILLTRKPYEIYICVSCGLLEDRKRDLFFYKLNTKEPRLGSPCMVGHTSMGLPSLKDEFGREVAVDKSALQFTPNARGLVLVDSIRMPYCREKNLHCLCPQCESCCFEENAVKIVEVELGYVSTVVKLNTMFPVHCVLVCEPGHLIALDESGRIYIWIMNSTWSAQTESYVIPSYEFLPSRIVDLKRIPKSASMVVGHNGYGEFSLWDIIKRSLLSRFSAPASTILDFLPVSLFSWPSKGLTQDKVVMEGCVRKLQEATMSWFSRNSEANISCPGEGEDVAVWLFICTSSDSYAQSAFYSSNYHLTSNGCWRLALMIKGIVILGAALDSSTTAVSSLSGTGIIGTLAGQAYIWDLATGSKIEALHDLEGNGVLHIATDDLTSSAVAIAGDGGQLCVYLRI